MVGDIMGTGAGRMREEHGKLDGNQVVTDDLVLYGVIDGDVLVDGGHFECYGAVLGDVTVRRGRAGLHGTLTGRAHNGGGELLVTGAVHGGVSTAKGAEERTTIDPTAMVAPIEA